MSEEYTESPEKGSVTRDQVLRKVGSIVRKVMRSAEGDTIKARTNKAASVLGLSPSRADDLMRREARLCPAEEHMNIIVRYERWLEYEERRHHAASERISKTLDRWRSRHATTALLEAGFEDDSASGAVGVVGRRSDRRVRR